MTSEFDLIRKYFQRAAPRALLGVGDDAALLAPAAGMELAVSTDMLIEGRHFRAGAAPRALGHKALAVNLSDMAAMGATPRWATLALALPSADEAWLAAFADGFFALAGRYGVDLVGGDTTRGPLAICVTIMGEAPAGKALRRSGAKPGDEIWVSGELGEAAYSVLKNVGGRRLDEPEPRVELGRRLLGIASAAIDVSDGFAQDLGHILEASGVGAEVHYEKLPKFRIADAALERKCVLSGGDDYELAFTCPVSFHEKIESIAREMKLPLTPVGKVTEKGEMQILDQGRPVSVERGFDHFAK